MEAVWVITWKRLKEEDGCMRTEDKLEEGKARDIGPDINVIVTRI